MSYFPMWFCSSLVLCCSLLTLSLPVHADKELWLIGGGEKICSSVDLQYCVADKRAAAQQYFDDNDALVEKSMRLSAEGIAVLSRLPNWKEGAADQARVVQLLKSKLPALSARTLLESEWHKSLADVNVSDDESQLIDDLFELRIPDRRGKPRRIHVYMAGSPATAHKTFEGYLSGAKLLAEKRQHKKPVVVFLTSSSYNVFEYVDYYADLFRQLGAEPHWLPLEPGFIRAENCDELDQKRFEMNGAFARASRFPEWAAYQRDMCLHPQKMHDLIANADAFFINGGDQSLTMRALQRDFGQFTPLARQLLDRIDAGVPLGGTSAGTAVQSGRKNGRVPMISDGTTFQAMRTGALAAEINAPLCPMSQVCTLDAPSGQLTYRPGGGIQTFSLGIADTHFYQRQREGRLLRLLLDTQTDFGFGVDEATALRARIRDDNNAELEVWGEGGVWIVDTRQAVTTRSRQLWKAEHVLTTRLLAGDKASLVNGQLRMSLCENKAPVADQQKIDADAYRDKDGRQWRHELVNDLDACVRDDGRWRYFNMPMTLLQELDSGNTQ